MSKKKNRSGGAIHSQDWKDYDENEGFVLYSYIKKKGKHKRAKSSSQSK